METKEYKYTGAICGGVIPWSMFDKDPWAYMMAYRLPDNKYKKYASLIKSGKNKEATKIFDKYGSSAIG